MKKRWRRVRHCRLMNNGERRRNSEMSDESPCAAFPNFHSGTRLFRRQYLGTPRPSAITDAGLNLKHLPVFRSAGDTHSIMEAARQLHVCQPAASKQLAQLESPLCLALVERRPRGGPVDRRGRGPGPTCSAAIPGRSAAESALEALLGLEPAHPTDLSICRALHPLTLEGKTPSPAALEFLRLLRARYPREDTESVR
jgi:hypothetical protein